MKLLPRTSFGSPLNMNALSPFNVGLDVRNLFFDRAAVSKRARKSTVDRIKHMALYARKSAVNSMRWAKREGQVSAPGKPPLAHTGVLKRNIFAWLDAQNDMALIGPIKINQRNAWGYGRHPIPAILEFGGKSLTSWLRVREHQNPDGTWVRTDMRWRIREDHWRSGVNKRARVRNIDIEARPYMNPALLRTVAAFKKKRLSLSVS
jgi:hypothetical protein